MVVRELNLDEITRSWTTEKILLTCGCRSCKRVEAVTLRNAMQKCIEAHRRVKGGGQVCKRTEAAIDVDHCPIAVHANCRRGGGSVGPTGLVGQGFLEQTVVIFTEFETKISA